MIVELDPPGAYWLGVLALMAIIVVRKHRRYPLRLRVFTHDNIVRNDMGGVTPTTVPAKKNNVLVLKNASVVGYENPCSSAKTSCFLSVLIVTAPTPPSKTAKNGHQSTPLQQPCRRVQRIKASPLTCHTPWGTEVHHLRRR